MFDFWCTVNAVLNLFKQYKKFTFVECLACQKVKTGSYILNCQNYIYDFRLVFMKFLYLFKTRWTLPSWSLPSFSTAPPATILEMTTLASSFLTVAPRKILFLSIVTEAKLWPAPLKLFASWRASCSTAVTEESCSWSESIPETERSLSSDKNTFNSSASGCVLWKFEVNQGDPNGPRRSGQSRRRKWKRSESNEFEENKIETQKIWRFDSPSHENLFVRINIYLWRLPCSMLRIIFPDCPMIFHVEIHLLKGMIDEPISWIGTRRERLLIG